MKIQGVLGFVKPMSPILAQKRRKALGEESLVSSQDTVNGELGR